MTYFYHYPESPRVLAIIRYPRNPDMNLFNVRPFQLLAVIKHWTTTLEADYINDFTNRSASSSPSPRSLLTRRFSWFSVFVCLQTTGTLGLILSLYFTFLLLPTPDHCGQINYCGGPKYAQLPHWSRGNKIYNAQCAFCQVLWPCGQKLKSKKKLSDGKKIFLRLFFLCCFRKTTLKLVSLFIFRH